MPAFALTPAADVPAALAPAVPAEPSPLVWAALAIAVLALAAAGVALWLALDARRRAEEALDAADRQGRPGGPDTAYEGRLARLERDMRELATAPRRAPAPEPARASPDPFASRPAAGAPPARSAPSRPAPAPAPAATPARRADDVPAWLERFVVDFARFAEDPSAAAAGFIAEHPPHGALAGPAGVALLDSFEGAKLWAVRAPGEAELWALVPGEHAVLNWSAHFAPQRLQVAAEVFGEAFDLVDGGAALRLEAPALVRRDRSDRLRVQSRGRLSGFRG